MHYALLQGALSCQRYGLLHGVMLRDVDWQPKSNRHCLWCQGRWDEEIELLGQGNSGDVWMLDSIALGQVATKSGWQRDLHEEAQMAGAVRHAHILPVLAVLTEGGHDFEPDKAGHLAMQRAGPTLRSILKQRRSLSHPAVCVTSALHVCIQ